MHMKKVQNTKQIWVIVINKKILIYNNKPINLPAIENGRQNTTTLTLLKIAKAIKLDISEFFLWK